MRYRHVLCQQLLLGALLASVNAASGDAPLSEPYKVWTRHAGTQVFAGPGDDYYATQQLPAGTECEVYQQLAGGWLAIRPPQGSYSLVLRSAVEPTGQDAARVTRDNTASRVGSTLDDSTTAVHVRLEAGELVQLVDTGATGEGAWVKIAPPAGEFRWIRVEDTSRKPSAPTEEVRLASASTEDTDANSPNAAPDAEASNDGLPTDFDQQLTDIEVRLARRVAGPANLWVFDDLERAAARLLSIADSPAERQAVEQIAARLGRFAELRERYRKSPGNASLADSASPAGPATDEATAAASSEYDAVGVLRPVVSKQGNAPPYALVDDQGQVVTFVTPSPTLNLQPHLGQRVGVSGTRGFLPAYRSRNIQTARVAPLDGSRTRY